jgi:hypothetical protein
MGRPTPTANALRTARAALTDLNRRIVKGGPTRADTLLRRTEAAVVIAGSVRPDGFPASTTGGGRGGSELTGVEAAVEQRVWPGGTPDPYIALARKALEQLAAAVAAIDAWADVLDDIDKLADGDAPTPGRRETLCCEPSCEDPMAPGRRGRCEACYRWIRRWEDAHPGDIAPPVPAGNIAARADERERTRQRVTGPGTANPAGIDHTAIRTVDAAIAGVVRQ